MKSGVDSTQLSALARPSVAAMRAYVPGMQPSEPGWIKLNTNENALPPSASVAQAIREVLDRPLALQRYPNPTSAPLRAAIADHHGLKPENVLVGNGCDDVLNLLMRVFAGEGRVAAMLEPSYSLYRVLAKAQGAEMREVHLPDDASLPVAACAASQANLFFLTSPNNPTGVAFPLDEILRLRDALPGVLVLDETYAPFADFDCVSVLAESPRLVLARSFSKAYSLAGLRVGYALGSAEMINLLDRVRDSYNVDVLAQAAAHAAIQDAAWLARMRLEVLTMRARMEAFYADLGWQFFPSAANFHFVRPAKADGVHGESVTQDCFAHLQHRKILVRYFPGTPLTASYLRISLGTEADLDRLQVVLREWRALG